MRIGIDMRMAGSGEGIGRYVEELASALAEIDFDNQYFLVINKDQKSKIKNQNYLKNKNFQYIEVQSRYYSFLEQTYFVWELLRLRLDLVHFASFNVPILYHGKFVVTIHDIIHHIFPGKKKRRFFHRLAYRLTFWVALHRAQNIIAVSHAARNDILKSFRLNPEKIAVVYEGVKEDFFTPLPADQIAAAKEKYGIDKPYLLYVGVWRQYKNIVRLAQAFDILKGRYNIQLVLAGKIDSYYPEIKAGVFQIAHRDDVRAPGFVPDEDLVALYQGASGFVIPSLMEGFGLISVEAQASRTPVAASNIPSLREVLGDSAIFFDPQNVDAIAEAMTRLLTKGTEFKERGFVNAQRFRWAQAAHLTRRIYQDCL